MKRVSITRDELYKLVWEKPIIRIAEKFEMNINELERTCQENQIPLPHINYWWNLKHGSKVEKTPLPCVNVGEGTINLNCLESINVDDYSVPFKLRLDFIKKEIHSSKSLPLEIPKSLKCPDEIVRSTIEYYNNLEKYKSRRNVLPESGKLSINVSKKSMKRALIIMDYFIKLVKARGHDIKYEYGRPEVIMYTTSKEFGIREKYDTIKLDKYSHSKEEPTGTLIFKANSCYHNTWSDTKTKSLEEKIPSIVAWFEASARELKAHWDNNARREKLEEERRRKEQELKDREDREIGKFYNLLDEAERWHKAKIIRDYIKYIETNHPDIHNNYPEWFNWANDKVDWYDPLIIKEDEILGYYDREESS